MVWIQAMNMKIMKSNTQRAGLMLQPTGVGQSEAWGRETPSWRKNPAAGYKADLGKQNNRVTLWLCQNSYWKLPFIVDFPIKHGDFP